jgi:hypothetical protein
MSPTNLTFVETLVPVTKQRAAVPGWPQAGVPAN